MRGAQWQVSLQTFVLVVGNARSGSSVLGSAIDAHPQAAVANEALPPFPGSWAGLGRDGLLAEVINNAERLAAAGRPAGGYHYDFGLPPSGKGALSVVGDKLWNPVVLILHGDATILSQLEDLLQVPVKLVETIRNPFDTIATMHRRSGLPLGDRMRWYFMHCEAMAALRERLTADRFLVCHHEDLIAGPAAELGRINAFLGLPDNAAQSAAVGAGLHRAPHRSAQSLAWPPGLVAEIMRRIACFDELSRYAGAAPAS